MTATATSGPLPTQPISALRAWMLHLWAFALPLITLAFLVTGPHSWWAALLWQLPLWLLVMVDNRAPKDTRQPVEDMPAWPFDLQVYALFFLQIANHILLGVMAAQLSVWPLADLGVMAAHLVTVLVLTGTNAGYSGIVLAHELVHRRKWHQFTMGRILLMFVFYEHFATEHVRGHHPRIGTKQDPATARFGERHREFVWRTIPAQFASAWRLEKVRLGDRKMGLFDRRMLGHRVLQGVVAQILLAVLYTWALGWLAMVFLFLQARTAVMLLETVNYIEHWGLSRQGNHVSAVDSWDTDNWFTLYTLVGLSRHADHHAQASRPYQKLRHFEQTPKMPRGYYGTIVMALINNDKYMELATEELKRCKLGPFREQRDGEHAEPESHLHPDSLRATA